MPQPNLPKGMLNNLLDARATNLKQAAALTQAGQDSHDFSDDPLMVQGGIGTAGGFDVPWWIWLLLAGTAYMVIKK